MNRLLCAATVALVFGAALGGAPAGALAGGYSAPKAHKRHHVERARYVEVEYYAPRVRYVPQIYYVEQHRVVREHRHEYRDHGSHRRSYRAFYQHSVMHDHRGHSWCW